MLVVIAIIALLTGIIITGLTGSKAKARDAKRISDIGNLQVAISLYFDRCKQYPFSLVVQEYVGCPTGITLGSFISTIPSSPSPGAYDYAALFKDNSTNVITDYVLHTKLESYNEVIKDALPSTPATVSGSTWYPPGPPSRAPANLAGVTIVCSNSAGSTDYCVGPR
jgi:type II secretory pathway pseudopilin PulG